MLCLHDVWFNWFDGAMKPYEVCEFFEWKNSDNVDLGLQVPLFHVKKQFFDYIEDGMSDLPEDLLSTVSGNSFRRVNNIRKPANIFIVTDGDRTLGVDTTGLNTPIRKSRLIPRHERLVREIISDNNSQPLKFEFTPLEGPDDDILNDPPNYVMVGLTRKEREMKKLLFDGLLITYTDATIHKLRYLYGELNYGNLKATDGLDEMELFDLIVKEASVGWSENHLKLLKLVVKSARYLERNYEKIIDSEKGDRKVG